MKSSPAAVLHSGLAALATSQGGPFTARQARVLAGYSAGQVRHFIQTQAPIIDAAKIIARADFLWEKYQTIAEADGLLKYASPEVLRAEKLRQERLADLGYEIVRITWRQIIDQPEETAARIRRAFSRALVKGSRTAP